jgi:hypothetical protein
MRKKTKVKAAVEGGRRMGAPVEPLFQEARGHLA